MRGMGKNLVKCAGVVVRTEKTQSNNYDIAIYFNEITDADMQKISSYVNKRLNLKKDAMAEEVL
jgi:hypothetical protein